MAEQMTPDEPVAYALYDRNDGELVSVQRWPTGTEHIAFDVRPLYAAHPETTEPDALAKVREYADRIGTGAYADDDSEWAQGYRQAQRDHIRRMAALLEPVENTEEAESNG